MGNLDSDPGGVLSKIILIIVLTSINAFFAASEMAIVSANKTKIKQFSSQGNVKAKLLEKLMEDPSDFLSTIQIGITLAGFFSSASAATGISNYINRFISILDIPYTHEISIIFITIILSYFTLVFGELVPKRIALKRSESIALLSVKTIYMVSVIAKPFTKILSFSTLLVLKLTGNNTEDVEEKISEEEIKSLVAQSEEDGCIEDDEKNMIYGIFEFNDKTCKEVMTSRKDTFLIELEDDINDILDEILKLGYSRVPVYKDNVDNIVGVLYVKDLLKEARRVGFTNIDIKSIIHKPYFVPENKKTNELFKILKEKKIHLALLVDEYGGFSGIVTMEDLIEEIMGEINDEYDTDESDINQIDESTFIVKGIVPLCEVKEKFNVNLTDRDYDTLNGYFIDNLGEVPKDINEVPKDKKEIILDDIKLEILKIGNKRIEKVKLSILK